MYAIAFDMDIDSLRRNYGDPYNQAYFDIRADMEQLGFEWTQGSLYIDKSTNGTLAAVYKAVRKLSSIEWFRKSVRDIRAFKVEDWSDFTDIVREG